MTSHNQTRRQVPCLHADAIINTDKLLAHVCQAVKHGEDIVLTAVCTTCGARVELRYTQLPSLPTLAAASVHGNSSATVTEPDDVLIEPWMNSENGIPGQLFVVHTDVVRYGNCGLSGMNLRGVNVRTKCFRYRCVCGFEWELCARDLQQGMVQGLHRSPASRRLTAG